MSPYPLTLPLYAISQYYPLGSTAQTYPSISPLVKPLNLTPMIQALSLTRDDNCATTSKWKRDIPNPLCILNDKNCKKVHV